MNHKVGFVGLGVMGASMARNILIKDFPLTVYARTKSKAEKLLDEGATWADSPAALARTSNVLCVNVDDGKAVREVTLGANGIAEGAAPGTIIIDFSTISPRESREIAEELSKRSLIFLDSPVTGGDVGARDGTLTIMVGGDETAFESVRPLYDAVGKKIIRFGPSGAGQLVKCVNQIAVALSILAMSESFAVARAASLPMDEVLSVIGGGAAGSWCLNNYGPRVLKGDFAPGFYARHMLKDIGIVREEARMMELDLPGLELVERLYAELVSQGKGELGNHALTMLYE